MRHDPDWRVRYEVANRVDAEFLAQMHGDEDPMVRERVAQRVWNAIAIARDDGMQ
jgi:hypothetical protein